MNQIRHSFRAQMVLTFVIEMLYLTHNPQVLTESSPVDGITKCAIIVITKGDKMTKPILTVNTAEPCQPQYEVLPLSRLKQMVDICLMSYDPKLIDATIKHLQRKTASMKYTPQLIVKQFEENPVQALEMYRGKLKSRAEVVEWQEQLTAWRRRARSAQPAVVS